MRQDLELLILAILLVLLLSISGCILGPIAASQLDSDQLQALKAYNDNGDLYICAIVEGGSRNGNLTVVLLPKGAPVEMQFGPDCHGTVTTKRKAP